MLRYVLAAVTIAALAAPASADPWKDESGNGREYHGDYRDHHRGVVPKGQRPPPGECKVWIPGVPAGHQPPPMSCREAREQAYYYGGRVIRHERRRDRRPYYGYDYEDYRY